MSNKYVAMCAIAVLIMAMPQAHTQTPKPESTLQVAPVPPPLDDESEASSKATVSKEDWGTISLAKSGLPTEAPTGIQLTKGELPAGCTRELVRLQWRPADPIDVYVIRPIGVDKPPVGLFLLNYSFDSKIFENDYWCSQAHDNGLAIVGFGSALSWQRFHAPRPMREWFVSELQEALATSTHDVQMLLNYLEARQDFDFTHVGIYGQGSGGAVAILSAAADSRLSAVDVTEPWGDWPDWLRGSRQIPEQERAAYLKPEFLQKVANLDPVAYLPELRGKALRIQQLNDDLVTPPAAMSKIAGAAPTPEDVVTYADRMAQHKAIFLGGVTQWLSIQLHPGGTVTAVNTR